MKIKKNCATRETKITGRRRRQNTGKCKARSAGHDAENMQRARRRQLHLVSIIELKALLTYATVKRHSWVQEADLGRAGATGSLVQDNKFVYQGKEGDTSNESNNGYKQPVFGKPENNLDIGPVPAVSQVVGEETPRVVVVFVGKHDAHTLVSHRAGIVVVSPDETEEEGSGRAHNSDIW
jgi:hypothetical protein